MGSAFPVRVVKACAILRAPLQDVGLCSTLALSVRRWNGGCWSCGG
jgi:hypothetical protein